MHRTHSLADPIAVQWFDDVIKHYVPLADKPVVFLPCTMTRPSQKSLRKTCPKLVSLHEAQELSLVILSDGLCLIPWEREDYDYEYPPYELTLHEIVLWRRRLRWWFEHNLSRSTHALFGALYPYHTEIILPPLLEVGKTFSGLLIVRNFYWSMVDDIVADWRIRSRNIEEKIKATIQKQLPAKYSTILEQILRWVDQHGSICEKDMTAKFFAPYCLEQQAVVLNWYTSGYAICKDPYLIMKHGKRVVNPAKKNEIRQFLKSK